MRDSSKFMKKTLVYHLYVGEDCEDNIAYDIHKFCLREFLYVFDEVKLTISLDDLNNIRLRNWGSNWANTLFGSKLTEINYVINTMCRESKTFYNKVLNNNDDDELVFFFHSKGTTNFKRDGISNYSVLNWICGSYFFNLSSLYDTIERVENGIKVFSGAFFVKPSEEEILNYKPFYAGAAQWVNVKGLQNLIRCGIVEKQECSDRFFAEKYCGRVLSEHDEWGLDYTSNIVIELGNLGGLVFYNGSEEDWNYISELYGHSDAFKNFICKIKTYVGFE